MITTNFINDKQTIILFGLQISVHVIKLFALTKNVFVTGER